MTISAIDFRTALIAVDLQMGILRMAQYQQSEIVVKNTIKLAQAFHAHRLPVIWVTALGLPPGRSDHPFPDNKIPDDFATLDPRLPIDGDYDLCIAKKSLSALSSDNVMTFLRTKGITQVVIAGLATGMGIESTARAAFDNGYNVSIAIDAVTDPLPEREHYSFKYTLPLFSESGSTTDIIGFLQNSRE